MHAAHCCLPWVIHTCRLIWVALNLSTRMRLACGGQGKGERAGWPRLQGPYNIHVQTRMTLDLEDVLVFPLSDLKKAFTGSCWHELLLSLR